MDDSSWSILLVEDDEDDYYLVNAWLSQAKSGQYHLKWISEAEAALRLVETETFDVVLVDYHLGGVNGLDLIRQAKINCQHVPFILLTGQGSYDVDLTAMEAGAADYLSKMEITPPLLERSIRYAIEHERAILEMRNAYEKVESIVDELTEELIEVRHKLISTVEVERRRIAQEIHDGPIQDLLGLSYLILGKANTPAEEELTLGIQGAISQVVDVLREACKELRSSSLAPFNLEESIHTFAADFGKKHPELTISIESSPDPGGFAERSRLALYRIYQQAMSNIAFHAQARNVKVSLVQNDGEAILEVRDDGRGFVIPGCLTDLALKGHFGLVGSTERATAVGGELQVESAPGQGALIRAIIPLHSQLPVKNS
jgi:signal transduction histidine kinase